MKKKKRSPLVRWISWRLEYAALLSAYWTLGGLGPGGRMKLARGLGWLVTHLTPIRRKLILDQLEIAFPEKSLQEREALLPATYAHLIAFGLEVLAMARQPAEEGMKSITIDPNLIGELERVKTFPHGCVVVTAHMGNWEWGAAMFIARGYEVAAVAKPMHNPLSERFIARVREKYRIQILSTEEHPRKIFTLVRGGGILALVADQDARRQGIFVPFFGKPASTAPGPAYLAYRLKVPMITLWVTRLPDGTLSFKGGDMVWPDPKAEAESEIRRLTEHHVHSLERVIREDPAQYFWIHNRWKTKPKKNKKKVAA